jgi:hypothetical protein
MKKAILIITGLLLLAGLAIGNNVAEVPQPILNQYIINN